LDEVLVVEDMPIKATRSGEVRSATRIGWVRESGELQVQEAEFPVKN